MTMRVRSNGEFIAVSGTQSGLRCNNTAATVTAQVYNYASGTVRSMSDQPTANFKALSAKGEIVNTPMSRVVTSRSATGLQSWGYSYVSSGTCTACTSLSTTLKSVTGQGNWTDQPVWAWPGPILDGVTFANAMRLAGTEALAGVAAPDILALVDFAERAQTARMLLSPIAELGDIFERIRGSKKYRKFARKSRGRGSLTSFLSANWLQYRYGIVPLISSINGLLKILTEAPPPVRRTSRGVSDIPEDSITNTVAFQTSFGGYGWNRTKETTATWSGKVRAGVLYEHTATMISQAGLSLHDLPTTAYELIPFSFVLDWFVNAGDVIAAITPKAGVRVLADWTTLSTRRHLKQVFAGSGAFYTSGCYQATGCPGITCQEYQDAVTRTPGLSVGFARQFAEFSIQKPIWQKRLADAFALVHRKLK